MTTIIKNGLVYDGSGNAPFKKDILIQNDRIVRLGIFNQKSGIRIIDAAGAIITPGFIDINTKVDHYFEIFHKNFHEKFIKEGVTTIIVGNEGASLAPLNRGSLDFMREVGEIRGININWQSFREFTKVFKKRRIGVNFGSLVGYTTLRRIIMGEVHRDLTNSEMDSLRQIFVDALREGALGLSFGFNDFYSKHIHRHEISELLGVLVKNGGVYATTLRNNRDKVVEAVKEIIAFAETTGVNSQINQLIPIKGFGADYITVKDLIEKGTANAHINFDCNLLGYNFVRISQLLPTWAENDKIPTILNYLRTSYFRGRLLNHFNKYDSDDLIIAWMPNHFQMLVGKTVKEFSLNSKLKLSEAILKLMTISNLKAVLCFANADLEILKDFVSSPNSIISSAGINLGQKNFNVFTRFIEWANADENFALEKAIVKITSLPAKKYMIKKRGLIKENYYADVVIIRDNRPSEVLINGLFALKEGKIQNVLAGRALIKNNG